MSSDRPGVAPSAEPDLAALLKARGAPLVEALEAHLPGSRAHAAATGSYAFAVSVELAFDRSQCEVAREAAVLHEIGLVYVSAATLARVAADRDESEVAAVDSHYEAGYKLARGAGIPEHVCRWLVRVRERFDGRGPEGIAGEQIPLESRLIRVSCLAATALARAEGGGEPAHREAIAALERASATELDPRLVAILSDVLTRAATA